MSLSAGVDIIEIARIREALEHHAGRFLRRVYTDGEQARYGERIPELAVRFAGKEAVSKVLGTGFTGISWRDIEILNDARGKPTVTLSGRARERATELGLSHIEISLSHSREYAVAFAIGYGAGGVDSPSAS
jgi:holo-[acyl-carrier protein] synthase